MQTNSYWIRNSGSTPSTGTGPTGDATTGMLIYILFVLLIVNLIVNKMPSRR